MAKQTLLEIVQNIASAMESDAISSISDTVESYQIALEVKTAYDELVETLKIPSKKTLVLLNASVDVTKPNYLTIPDTCKSIDWFQYDSRNENIIGNFYDVQYLDPIDFIAQTIGNAGQTGAGTVTDFSGATLTVLSTQNPTYWTTFDNQHLVTDSYNVALDTTLQQSKTLCWGELNNSFILSDTYIPGIDEPLFPLLLAESKSACFANIKQAPSAKDEQRAHRQYVRLPGNKWRANQRHPYERSVDFGRRGQSGGYAWPFPRSKQPS